MRFAEYVNISIKHAIPLLSESLWICVIYTTSERASTCGSLLALNRGYEVNSSHNCGPAWNCKGAVSHCFLQHLKWFALTVNLREVRPVVPAHGSRKEFRALIDSFVTTKLLPIRVEDYPILTCLFNPNSVVCEAFLNNN